EPFDEVRAMNGRPITSGVEVQEEARRHPPGISMQYTVRRQGETLDVTVATVRLGIHAFKQFLFEGFVAGFLFLVLGATIFTLRPGRPESRLFLGFCLIWFAIGTLYTDAHSTYRFTKLFLTAWALSPAAYIHLALTFPERRTIAIRHPW